MKIRIICLGKIKERYIAEGNAEFVKRLGRFCSLEIHELADERIVEPQSALDKEMRRILPIMHKAEGLKIVLDERGTAMDSPAFARLLEKHALEPITFVIGSAHGLHVDVKKAAHMRIALGSVTWTHQMARLLLLEQIYRGVCINKNIPYHK